MALLGLDSLRKSYGALAVTQDFSLQVEAGDLVGILGPNGAGKTTLFNLITGTVRPDSGRVQFDGRDVTTVDASQRCHMGIARSFQVPHPFVGMTVYENILVGATFGRGAGDPRRRALDVMQQTGMAARANTLAGSLTLLDRKRLEMARALAADPKLLLLDEIAGGLTDSECVSLLETIRDIHATGVTIIWIEHVVHALMSVAKRLVVVDFGRKVIEGVPAEVMASSAVKSIYMGEDALD
ncbi:MAG: ABC transporter ATP-binding protein [Rhodobacter sp.]|nr:ABC transporter ATP-binding protein [Paracoccaceae bacterium]MCC0076551.1 ABC transporter ATP-binding protein [Rhodobacter sp.]